MNTEGLNLSGLQCTFQCAWDDLMFNRFRRETLLPVIPHPESLFVLPPWGQGWLLPWAWELA